LPTLIVSLSKAKAGKAMLHSDQTGTAINFVVGHGWDNKEILSNLRHFGEMLAQDLKIDHLNIRLIDDHLNTKEEIQIN
jgi:undecaprenyl pyrophosphate synthase